MPNLKNKKVIKDQQGQRKYPGRVTKIQGNTMATTGYGDIPLYVVPNVGNPMVVPANSGNRVFLVQVVLLSILLQRIVVGWRSIK